MSLFVLSGLIMYPLVLSEYLMKIPFIALSSSFPLWVELFRKYTLLPKVFMYFRSSFLPVNSSNGVLLFELALVKHLFLMYTAVSIALSHHFTSSLVSFSSAFAIWNMVCQFLSATPFCCGVLSTVNSRRIFSSLQNL